VDDRWYFAYGSNLDTNQKERRTGEIREARCACLPGYRITFDKLGSDRTGKANITPDDTHVVWGVAYLCSGEALTKMDDYEGVAGGHYRRESLQVRCESDETLDAVTYVAGEQHVGSPIPPTPEYLHRIVSGARNHGLPEEYIREIQQAAQDTE
jgi:gamma-glutamylcyclotransferase